VATSLRAFRRHITQNIKVALLAPDFFEPAIKIVGIENGKSAGPIRKRRKNLLIGGDRRRKLRTSKSATLMTDNA